MKGTRIGMTRLLVQHLLHRSKGEMLRWEQCWGGNNVEVGTMLRWEQSKDIGTRAWQKIAQTSVIYALYQFKANVGKISSNKSWGMNNPAIFSLKVLSRVKNIKWHGIFLRSGLTLNHAFSLGHGFSSRKVLPASDKRAQQRNKGMVKHHTKS